VNGTIKAGRRNSADGPGMHCCARRFYAFPSLRSRGESLDRVSLGCKINGSTFTSLPASVKIIKRSNSATGKTIRGGAKGPSNTRVVQEAPEPPAELPLVRGPDRITADLRPPITRSDNEFRYVSPFTGWE